MNEVYLSFFAHQVIVCLILYPLYSYPLVIADQRFVSLICTV